MTILKHTRKVVIPSLAVAGALALAACGAVTGGAGTSSESGNQSGAEASGFQLADYIQERVDSGEPLRIKLSYHDPSVAFATPIKEGMELAAEEYGVEAQLIGPTGGDAAKQVNELQTLIQQKAVDGLAVSSASSDALKPVIAEAYNAGIPIISFNTDNPASDQIAFVGQDLKASGKSQAEEMLSYLPEGASGKVVVFSLDTGAGWSHDRFSGFEEGLSGSGLEIVGPVNVGNEPNEAYSVVESTMAGQDGVVGIAGLDCCSAPAAAQWVEQSGKAGEVVMVGFDLLPSTYDFIKNGVQTFTISQNPREQGFQAVKVLVEFLQNDVPIENVDTGAEFITLENLADATVEG